MGEEWGGSGGGVWPTVSRGKSRGEIRIRSEMDMGETACVCVPFVLLLFL